MCQDREAVEELGGSRDGVTHCLQEAGEVMVVPTAWWHATCNLEAFTLGVGGQDSCDMKDCTPPGPPDEDPHDLHMRKQFCRQARLVEHCHGDYGAQEYEHYVNATGGQLHYQRQRGADGKRSHTVKGEEWAYFSEASAAADKAEL